METAPEPSAGVPGVGVLVSAGLVGAATVAAMVAGGASGMEGILPVGGAAVVLLALLLVLFGVGVLAVPRIGLSGRALVAAAVLLVLWTGATLAWSIVPDRSWDVFNKHVAFAAFLGLGIGLGGLAGRRAARMAAWTLTLGIAFVLGWAFLAKVVPALDPAGDRVARLREPVDYWNALALLADAGLVLGLWVGHSRRTVFRLAGGVLVYTAVLALLLTISRAGIVAAVVVLALWLGLSGERVKALLLLASAALPAAAVGAWAFTRPALVEAGAGHADRVSDGTLLGVFTLLGAGLVVAVVVFVDRVHVLERARRPFGRGVRTGVGLAVVAAAVALFAAVASARHDISGSCSQVVNQPGRFTSLNPNNRWCWWKEAWHVFANKVPLGAGAGSFEVARKRYRVNAGSVLEPHSVPVQELSDGGLVALVLFLGLAGAGGAVGVCAVRRLEGGERTAAIALTALPTAYAVHALVDYDWDFLAVTAPTMVTLGVLAAAGRPGRRAQRRPFFALATVLVALTVLGSFSFPRLADRSNRSAIRAIDAGDLAAAHDRAERARFFNPLSLEPIFTLAGVAHRQGREQEALDRYVQAVELQPENPATWYALGLYEFQVAENMCDAYRFFNNAYTLDSAGSEWVPGGVLDITRDAVNAGACESR